DRERAAARGPEEGGPRGRAMRPGQPDPEEEAREAHDDRDEARDAEAAVEAGEGVGPEGRQPPGRTARRSESRVREPHEDREERRMVEVRTDQDVAVAEPLEVERLFDGVAIGKSDPRRRDAVVQEAPSL